MGPGGAFVEKISASNRLSVSSGLSPRSAAMPLATNFSKLKPLPRKPWKNFGGVIAAVAAMWATTSRTLHPAHSEGVSQFGAHEVPDLHTHDRGFAATRAALTNYPTRRVAVR